ncbi:MAG: alpha/beta fold hydrolase [Deltaproteobacteria bacterium]|nr:alpha/beta fold hydrolase [Deltaproteobacteria bacterium]
MNISISLIKVIEVALDTLIKTTGTDIRLHGAQNVPDQPVLYVINHFTRIETILMPYIIKKSSKKFPVSMADKSFFDGEMGTLMDKVGAISTIDPNRDKVFINALLTDNHPVIIFPEGQIIKDKKIVEKGKYLVYNAGLRRPPHSGAAQIALRTEFIREKLRNFRTRGDSSSSAIIAEHFGFDPADADRIINKETYIVPVNITYYPVRAQENAVSKLANRFINNISTRFQEELEVEGPMILGKVDIDINFGKPISVKKYIATSSGMSKMLADNNLYLNPEEFKKLVPFKKLCVSMRYDYMNAIYGMTTVNHDHLFSYILTKYRNSFSENDFKNRVFLAIEYLRKIGLSNCHTSLYRKQFYLLTDDYHEKYDNFIKEAVSSNYIKLEKGIITKNSERFSRKSDFHTIRRDNIIEVLRNEIEPLCDLTRTMDRLMFLPAFFVRWKIRNHFVRLDKNLFEKDYQEYYIKDESKPRNIGEPFFLKRFFSRKGVILVHGYMAAPEEIRPLADYLYKNGYNVYGVRLRGHGTAPEDLALRNWEKWYDSASRAYIIMKNSVGTFSIGGFSMGAGIAMLQSANKPGRFAGVVSINAPFKLKGIASKFASIVVAWNKLLSKFHVNKGKMEFVENVPENPEINYLRNPVSGGNELEKLMKLVENQLKNVTGPVLIIQGSDDPVVNAASGLEIFDNLGTKDKQLLRIYADHHGILRGQEADKVNAMVLMFLEKVSSSK